MRVLERLSLPYLVAGSEPVDITVQGKRRGPVSTPSGIEPTARIARNHARRRPARGRAARRSTAARAQLDLGLGQP
jgi:hypothetical protein